MKWMGWSCEDLDYAPLDIVEMVLELMQEEYEAYRDMATNRE